MHYLKTNSTIPSISKLFSPNKSGDSAILIHNHQANKLYDNIKIDHAGLVMYVKDTDTWYYPPGVKLSNGIFEFTMGANDGLCNVTVNMDTKLIILRRESDDYQIVYQMNPEPRFSDPYYGFNYSGRIWTITSIDTENTRLGVYYYDLTWRAQSGFTEELANSNTVIFGNPLVGGHSGSNPIWYREEFLKYANREQKRVKITAPNWSSNSTDGFYIQSYFITNLWDGHDLNWSDVILRLVYGAQIGYNGFVKNEYLILDEEVESDDTDPSIDPDEPEHIPPLQPDTPDYPGNYPDDPTPEPELPDISVTDSGFVTVFRPSLTNLRDLASYLWSDTFDIATFKKMYADPMEAIIGLNMLPFTVEAPNTLPLSVGNIPTPFSFSAVSSQWVRVDCGSVAANPPWGSYVDYAPHTKVSIFLPYIGINNINADDIVGGVVHVTYHIDIITGSLVAYLIVTKDGVERILYSFNGQCSISVPMSSVSYAGMFSAVVGAAATAVTGGTAGAIAASTNLAQGMISDKISPDIARSGSFSQACGFLGVQYPYLIWERPTIGTPEKYETMRGVGSQITSRIGDASGYTVVSDINLTGINGTDAEKNEIISLLKGGVLV